MLPPPLYSNLTIRSYEWCTKILNINFKLASISQNLGVVPFLNFFCNLFLTFLSIIWDLYIISAQDKVNRIKLSTTDPCSTTTIRGEATICKNISICLNFYVLFNVHYNVFLFPFSQLMSLLLVKCVYIKHHTNLYTTIFFF